MIIIKQRMEIYNPHPQLQQSLDTIREACDEHLSRLGIEKNPHFSLQDNVMLICDTYIKALENNKPTDFSRIRRLSQLKQTARFTNLQNPDTRFAENYKEILQSLDSLWSIDDKAVAMLSSKSAGLPAA